MAAGGNGAALLVLLLIALFSVLFGTRHIDATEHHEGMVLAVAFESVVKLAAFLIVGVYVTYVMFDGFGDMLGQAALPAGRPATDGAGGGGGLCRLAPDHRPVRPRLLFLDRQFQVAVIENVDESHLRIASWLLSGLPAGDQSVRAADRPGRRAARRRRRRPIRPPAADGLGPRMAGPDRLSGRPVGGVGHDHRRHGGAEHDDLQRSGHARAAAGAASWGSASAAICRG